MTILKTKIARLQNGPIYKAQNGKKASEMTTNESITKNIDKMDKDFDHEYDVRF